MNIVRNSKVILAVVLAFVCMCVVPQIINAQAIKASVGFDNVKVTHQRGQ
jgi:hypothetical protein